MIFGYNVKVIPIETYGNFNHHTFQLCPQMILKKKNMFLLHFVASSRRNVKNHAYVL